MRLPVAFNNILFYEYVIGIITDTTNKDHIYKYKYFIVISLFKWILVNLNFHDKHQ